MRDQLSATLSALADPTRRAILARLAQGEASVTELAAPFNISQPAISKHLKVLEEAKLISRSRVAQSRPCRLEAAPLRDLAGWLEILPTLLGSELRPSGRLSQGASGRRPQWPWQLTPRSRRSSSLVASRRRLRCLFDAWLDPKAVGKWLFATPGGVSSHVEIDGRVGGGFAIHEQRGETLATHFGEYREIARPHRIVFSLATRENGLPSSVTVEIEPDGVGSVLTLTHKHLAAWASIEVGPARGLGRHTRRTGARHGRSGNGPYARHLSDVRGAAHPRLESLDGIRSSAALAVPSRFRRSVRRK